MKPAAAKAAYQIGAFDQAHSLITFYEGTYSVTIVTPEKPEGISLERARGGNAKFKTADAAIAAVNQIGIREIKIFLLSKP